MNVSHIRALECPICFEEMVDPVIHNECGNTFDRECALDSVRRYGRCPSCQQNATQENFKPNVALRDSIQEMQDRAVHGVKASVKVEMVPIKTDFAPTVEKNEKAFERVSRDLKAKDKELYQEHIDKTSTRKLRVDWGNGYVAVYKSGNWHFYKIGKGKSPELCKCQHFDQGILILISLKD